MGRSPGSAAVGWRAACSDHSGTATPALRNCGVPHYLRRVWCEVPALLGLGRCHLNCTWADNDTLCASPARIELTRRPDGTRAGDAK